jgi:hypothetical protein
MAAARPAAACLRKIASAPRPSASGTNAATSAASRRHRLDCPNWSNSDRGRYRCRDKCAPARVTISGNLCLRGIAADQRQSRCPCARRQIRREPDLSAVRHTSGRLYGFQFRTVRGPWRPYAPQSRWGPPSRKPPMGFMHPFLGWNENPKRPQSRPPNWLGRDFHRKVGRRLRLAGVKSEFAGNPGSWSPLRGFQARGNVAGYAYRPAASIVCAASRPLASAASTEVQ